MASLMTVTTYEVSYPSKLAEIFAICFLVLKRDSQWFIVYLELFNLLNIVFGMYISSNVKFARNLFFPLFIFYIILLFVL